MDRKMVKFMQEQYPPGTRIRPNSMNDPYAPITPGTEGVVDVVDDDGQLHMKWDNGRTLALIPGEDSFTVLPPKLETLKLYAPLTADLYERNRYGDLENESVVLDGRSLQTYREKSRRRFSRAGCRRKPSAALCTGMTKRTASIVRFIRLFSQWKNGTVSSGAWQNAALRANWMQKNWKR